MGLKDKKIWTDPAQKEKLLGYLAEAKTGRFKAPVAIFAEHLVYGLDGDKKKSLLETFPVAAVLEEIGLPAVPSLVDVLKTVDPKTDKKAAKPVGPLEGKLQMPPLGTVAEQKRYLALLCILDIYSQGDAGKELAKYRLELEIKNSKGRQKELLEEALKELDRKP